MNPDSFKGKVWLSLIDKIIIGVIAGIIALHFQQKADESKKLFDESVAVSKIHTEIYVKQRKSLTDAMEDFFLFIEDVRSKSEPSDDEIKKFQKLRYKFNVIFEILAGDDPSIMGPGRPFVESIGKMSEILTNSTKGIDEIDEQRKLIQQHYSAVLDKLQELTREKVKEEFEAAAGKKKSKAPVKEEKIEASQEEK